MDWAQVLVIILAIFLAIFLLLGIALAVLLIKVTRQIKSVTESAARTADHIEHAVGGISKGASPLFFAKMVARYIKKTKRSRR